MGRASFQSIRFCFEAFCSGSVRLESDSVAGQSVSDSLLPARDVDLAEPLQLLQAHILEAGQIEQAVEQHRGVAVRQHKAVAVEPMRIGRIDSTNVGLVLVIGIDDLDLDVLAAAIKILGRHACSFDRTHAVGVLEKARDVVQYAYSNDAVRYLGACRPAGKASQQHNESVNALHHSLPFVLTALAVFRSAGPA